MACTQYMAGRRETDDPLADVKRRVWEWAQWFRDRIENGYPPHSWEGRAMLRGGSAPRPQDAAHALPEDPEAQEVEDLVINMDDDLRRAIIERHVQRRTDRDGARNCAVSQATYKELCNRAYWWLKGRMGG